MALVHEISLAVRDRHVREPISIQSAKSANQNNTTTTTTTKQTDSVARAVFTTHLCFL